MFRVGNTAVFIDTAHNKMLYTPDHKTSVNVKVIIPISYYGTYRNNLESLGNLMKRS